MLHEEEKVFTLRIEGRCLFPEDYDGEEDGYEWVASFQPALAAVVKAAMSAANAQAGWTLRTRNRGRASEDEVTLVLEKTFNASESDAASQR